MQFARKSKTQSMIWALCVLLWQLPTATAQNPLTPRADGYFKPNAVAGQDQNSVQPSANNTKPVSTASTQPAGKAFEPGQVVAMVGGEPLFLAEMMLEVNQIMERMLGAAPPEVLSRERQNLIYILAKRKYVDQKLMLAYAKKVLPKEAKWESLLEQVAKDFDEKALPELIEKSGVENSLMYDAVLRSQGSSLRQVKHTWCEDQLVRYFNFQGLDLDPYVSHEEMLTYYSNNQAEFSRPARAKWEEMMVRFDRFPTRDEAFEAIVKMGNEVAFGAVLSAVAERSSHGFTAHRGGQYDWTLVGDLAEKKIEEQLFQLPVGYLSDWIETRFGLHIIRVTERENAYVVPFHEAQVEIKAKLVDQKRDAVVMQHIEKLRKEFPVEILWQPVNVELLNESQTTEDRQ